MATVITTFEGWTFIISTLLLALGFYYIGRKHGRCSDGLGSKYDANKKERVSYSFNWKT